MAKNKDKKEKKSESLLLTKSHIDYDSLNKYQREADAMIKDWFYSKKRHKSDMIFRLGGCAGSGKSYFIRYLIEDLKLTRDDCYVVAYTGQAVNVLRQAGIYAKTIHSTFMQAQDVPLRDKKGNIIYRSGIPIMTMEFRPVKRIPDTVKLVICDEASFLPEKLQDIILSYNVPILEVGDPVQLPPVAGEQCFKMDNLDYFMEGIMRQAADSEIIDLATRIRFYMPIDLSKYGKNVRFLWAQPDIEDTFYRFLPFFKSADSIITTTNKDRTIITDLYRKEIIKADGPFPMKGERLICRRSDWNLMLGDFPLTNGTQGHAVHKVGKSEVDFGHKTYTLDFRPDYISNDYYDGLLCDTEFLKKEFGDKDDIRFRLNPGKKFEYAHAITTHLAQGSQFPSVLFLDKFIGDPEYHMRVRYTAATRAEETLTYVLPYSKYGGWTDLRKGGFRP